MRWRRPRVDRWALWYAVAMALVGAAACGDDASPTQPSPIPPEAVSPPAPPTAREHFLNGAGDIAECGRPGAERTATLLDQLDGTVFTAGDNAYPHGRPEDFQNCYEPTWGRHRARTFPAPGNHDYETPGAAGYFAYFGAVAAPERPGYYSFDLGAWHVVSLNSNVAIGSGSPQLAWLRSDLAASASRCTIAIFHHPLFSSSVNGGTTRVRDLWRVLYELGVEVVVNGHEHVYERFSPQDPDQVADPLRGIRQFTVGTGGAAPYGFGRIERHSEARASAWGVIRFALRANEYSWEFVPVAGEAFRDAGTATCH